MTDSNEGLEGSPLSEAVEGMIRERQRVAERDYVDGQLDIVKERLSGVDRLVDAKFVTYQALMDLQAEKVALALSASDKAITKAEVATEKRFDLLNEFRGQAADWAAGFASKETVEESITRIRELMEERFTAQKEAVTKAEVANEKRFEAVTEFREQLNSVSNTFLPRNEYDAKHDALTSRIAQIEKLLDQRIGQQAGVKTSAATLVGAVGASAAFVTVVVFIANIITSK